jgi:hypothetical protein
VGAAAVRAAVSGFIATVPGITKMFRDEPWIVTSDAWETEDGLPGTVAYTHINRDQETRYAMSGQDGSGAGKAVVYDMSVVVLYQYVIPDQPDDKDSWVDGLDALIDAIKARLRSDPTLGTGQNGAIWQAGEGDPFGGGADIVIQRDLPKLNNGKVLSWNNLTFKVVEMLPA